MTTPTTRNYALETSMRMFGAVAASAVQCQQPSPASLPWTITPYSTATLNSASFTSNHNSFVSATVPGPSLPSVKRPLEHSPVNNFNAQEVSNFLNNSWKEALSQYYDNNLPEAEKPELHKSTTWEVRSGQVWGQRGNLMANGNDFFAELRKSSLSQASSIN
ncbi:20202_t:CDS:2 [Rhizophagus irregularis]|nr:20202_t:CDS:2 [Rhizophagus irregularis]